MKLYQQLSEYCAQKTTKLYSTSFSFGIKALAKQIRQPINNIYGFVRIADEIVDSFHNQNQELLLADFKRETYRAIDSGLSTNPIIHAYQSTVREYNIEHSLIEHFFHSMEMDLEDVTYNQDNYKEYIHGSAEVVGLMCMHVFTNGDQDEYNRLKEYAVSLGSALQKVNFLRDLSSDYHELNRTYFPEVDLANLKQSELDLIVKDIRNDFDHALIGIKQLNKSCRFAVYVVYVYFNALLVKISKSSVHQLLTTRIRIPNLQKYLLLIRAYFVNLFNLY